MSLTKKEFSETLSILTDFSPSVRVLVAFSGGADSLALALLCKESIGADSVEAFYVNHKIRSEEELSKEIALNIENCRKIGIKLNTVELDSEELKELASEVGTEAAARKLRYRELENYARENSFSYIATAHHFDDQIETLLMKAVSNAPLPAFRGIAEKKGLLIRPLLEFRKTELEQYLTERGFRWSTDSTNKDNSIRRNEIRNQIIPYLHKEMPDYEKRLTALRSLALKEENTDDPVSDYRLFDQWDNLIGTQLPQTLIERVRKAFRSGKNEVISANGGTFCVYNKKVYLINPLKGEEYSGFSVNVDSDKEKNYLLPGGYELCVTEQERLSTDLHINLSKLQNPVLRYVKTGDSIKLKDGSKMVLRLLQDMKIPSVLRKRVPVLVDSDEVCAVFGTVFGGKDRVCNKLRTSLADGAYYVYIKNTDFIRIEK